MLTAELTKAFEDNLAIKPYCSNEKGSLVIRSKSHAKTKNYIQYNNPISIKWLAYDLDNANIYDIMQRKQLPTPNIVVQNKSNGKSHVFYGLKTPVFISDNARQKPKTLLQAINFELMTELESDQGFSQFISKNPLVENHWTTTELNSSLFELNDFLEYLTLPAKPQYKASIVGIGRNVTVFESLRKWAYKHVLAYRLGAGITAWQKAVLGAATGFNAAFPNPLHDSEVRAIAKSVAKWTWNKYTKRMNDKQFSIKQSERQHLQVTVRYKKTLEKRLTACVYSMLGLTHQQIANLLNVPRRTISRWLK